MLSNTGEESKSSTDKEEGSVCACGFSGVHTFITQQVCGSWEVNKQENMLNLKGTLVSPVLISVLRSPRALLTLDEWKAWRRRCGETHQGEVGGLHHWRSTVS